MQLIISPRDKISQEESISLQTSISLEEIIELENSVEDSLDFSALVVPIGGLSSYPSMIVSTTNLLNLTETVSHEWIHNYLALRPLGMRYSSSPQLRTMNETAASIAGKEISQEVIRNFYPEIRLNRSFLPKNLQASFFRSNTNHMQDFDFSMEMFETRLVVDDLLAEGKIDEAENFMESRRQFFWDNGYQIRKLNQAYFAFHGAYADEPFTAAGKDPVGDDVRLFRAKQPSLSDFIRKISWIYTYSQLRIASRAF
jgi:hypothetical protein